MSRRRFKKAEGSLMINSGKRKVKLQVERGYKKARSPWKPGLPTLCTPTLRTSSSPSSASCYTETLPPRAGCKLLLAILHCPQCIPGDSITRVFPGYGVDMTVSTVLATAAAHCTFSQV